MVLGLIEIGFVAMLIAPPWWRWFVAVVVAGGVLWPLYLLYPDGVELVTLPWWQFALGAIAVGAANTAVGASVGWLIRWVVERSVRVILSRRPGRA